MAPNVLAKWGCEVHAFTTSDGKEAEARELDAPYVHNTKQGQADEEVRTGWNA